MMEFQMVHALPLIEIWNSWGTAIVVTRLSLRSTTHRCVKARHVMAHAILFPWFLLHGTQPLKPDSTGCRLPLEVEHWMNRWNLDPPGPPLECFPDELRIITWADDELVAVLNVCILKWYLRLGLLLPVKICDRLSFWLVRIQVSSKLRGV